MYDRASDAHAHREGQALRPWRTQPPLHLRYTASYGEFTQDRLRNPLAAALWPSPSTPTPTSSPTRRTTYQSSHKTSYADGLQYGCSKRAGERIPAPPSCAAFYLQNAAFPKWAMLGSNQRPPPCKGGALPLS